MASTAIVAITAAMGGIDALVFTGGVGEQAPAVRAAAADGLGFLGVRVDEERNRAAQSDAVISGAAARVSPVVVTAREDREWLKGKRPRL